MADYIQKDNPLRFPEAGTDWYEEVGVGTGTPVSASDLINATLTYTYSGNTIIYDYDNEVDTWTGRVTRVAAPIPPTECLWEETGNKIYPKTLTNNVQVGGTISSPKITMAANGSITTAGPVNAPQFYATVTGDYAFRVNSKGGYYVDGSGNESLYIRNDTDSNPVISLNGADGSITAAGTVTTPHFDLETLPALP